MALFARQSCCSTGAFAPLFESGQMRYFPGKRIEVFFFDAVAARIHCRNCQQIMINAECACQKEYLLEFGKVYIALVTGKKFCQTTQVALFFNGVKHG